MPRSTRTDASISLYKTVLAFVKPASSKGLLGQIRPGMTGRVENSGCSEALLLNFNLSAFRSHNLRPAPIAGYLSCHAHPQAFVLVFRPPKLFAI